MSAITTHVLDTAQGRPAQGVPVQLDQRGSDGGWSSLGSGRTDADGRLRTLLPQGQPLQAGTYRLRFDTAAYHGAGAFFPLVEIVFTVAEAGGHCHVPLLLSPYGYSTYRGS
jgi:5-hydroxyisourate hydrolase